MSGTGTLSPTFGASPTANHLLICIGASGTGSIAPTISAGWTSAAAINTSMLGTQNVNIWYKIAAGGDTAPTVAGGINFAFAVLAEFSGNLALSPVDVLGTNSGTTSPFTVATTKADVAAGELFIYCLQGNYASSTSFGTPTLNNGMTPTVINSTSKSTSPNETGFGITTGNTVADQVSATATASPTGLIGAAVSFKLAAGGGTAPTVTSINPTSGSTAGGTSVVITGTTFTGASAVTFGATAATGFTVDSATQITATSPAHAAGVVDITVTTASGTSTTGAGDQFTYVAPIPDVVMAVQRPV